MITCPNCRGQLPENAAFCKYCGSQTMPQPVVQNIDDVKLAPKKKKSPKKIIVAIIAVILVIAIVIGAVFIFKWSEKKKNETELLEATERLEEVLKESTTKPIVDIVVEDYDSNGTYEAYAVVGESDEQEKEHPEFYDADIYYVNMKKAQPVKENINGEVNGTISLDNLTYVSIEVYEDDTEEGKSFIYTSDGEKPAEADISGEYSDVHEIDGKIFGLDDDGNKIEVTINPSNNKPPEVIKVNEYPSRLTVDSDLSGVFAVKNDGTVVCANQPFWFSDSEAIRLRNLRDVVSISVSMDHIAALKSDGTVFVNEGPIISSYGGDDVTEWKDIIAVETGYMHTVGLKSDGTVVATQIIPENDDVVAAYGKGDVGQSEVSGWTDIIAISVGTQHTVGLRKDGTVVAVGSNTNGQCDVEGWTDIIAISAGYYHTVGLRKDGTVVSTEYINDPNYPDDVYTGQCSVTEWKDIVSISAGDDYTLGLKKDGTVVVTEYLGNKYNGHAEVDDWKEIVAISAGDAQAIGLKKDGTVIVTECNIESEYTRYQNQSFYDDWSDIKMPY